MKLLTLSDGHQAVVDDDIYLFVEEWEPEDCSSDLLLPE